MLKQSMVHNTIPRFLAASSASFGLMSTVTFASNDPGSIVDVAQANGSFSTFMDAVHESGLWKVLAHGGPYTVFAPTDAAFAKLDPEKLDALMHDKTRLREVLAHHVVPGRMFVADVKTGPQRTVNGESVRLITRGNAMLVDGVQVTVADVSASNGVIHVIDEVIMPK
jgi:uncharacterized surface protein with fasciclin (FAS1) repeats